MSELCNEARLIKLKWLHGKIDYVKIRDYTHPDHKPIAYQIKWQPLKEKQVAYVDAVTGDITSFWHLMGKTLSYASEESCRKAGHEGIPPHLLQQVDDQIEYLEYIVKLSEKLLKKV